MAVDLEGVPIWGAAQFESARGKLHGVLWGTGCAPRPLEVVAAWRGQAGRHAWQVGVMCAKSRQLGRAPGCVWHPAQGGCICAWVARLGIWTSPLRGWR